MLKLLNVLECFVLESKGSLFKVTYSYRCPKAFSTVSVQLHLSTFSGHVHPLTTEKTSISSIATIDSLSQTKENEPFSTMSPGVQRSDVSSSLSTGMKRANHVIFCKKLCSKTLNSYRPKI